MIRFSAGIPLQSGNVLVAGEHLDDAFNPTETILVELNTRGRGVGEKRSPAQPDEKITSLSPLDRGYVMASNIKIAKTSDKYVRLAWFDSTRTYVRDLVLKDSVLDYESYSLIPANDGNGFIAVVHARTRQIAGVGAADEYGILYRITATGKIVWKRAYRTGVPSLIHGISAVGTDAYLMTGRMQAENGRISGYVMKINNDGTLMWQRPYPRGVHALLRKSAARDDGRTVLAGQITPFGETYSTGWVMELDKNGEILWQRYFPLAGYETDARGVMVHEDGRATVMLNAIARDVLVRDDYGIHGETNKRDHIRLLTLSPRGELLRDEPYIEGQNAQASQLARGHHGERVVTAFVQGNAGSLLPDDVVLITEQIRRKQGRLVVGADGKLVEEYVAPDTPNNDPVEEDVAEPIPPEFEGDEEGHPSFRGWVFVATSLDPYKDPCLPREIPKVQDQ